MSSKKGFLNLICGTCWGCFSSHGLAINTRSEKRDQMCETEKGCVARLTHIQTARIEIFAKEKYFLFALFRCVRHTYTWAKSTITSGTTMMDMMCCAISNRRNNIRFFLLLLPTPSVPFAPNAEALCITFGKAETDAMNIYRITTNLYLACLVVLPSMLLFSFLISVADANARMMYALRNGFFDIAHFCSCERKCVSRASKSVTYRPTATLSLVVIIFSYPYEPHIGAPITPHK